MPNWVKAIVTIVVCYVALLIVSIGVLVAALLVLDASFPEPSDAPVALCPKVEYRVKPSKSRRTIRIDTVTAIPPECR